MATSSSIVMPIQNGQIPTTNATSESGSSEKKSQVQQNKDMFLQLLVAEMQYQDPLEPTDNSEYIQQLYSMSQTESVLQVQEDMENMTARNLVGKYVTVQDPVTGEFFEGKVDSVVEQGGVLKISMNGEAYEVANVKQIHDTEYFVAVTGSETLKDLVSQLPEVEKLRLADKADLEKAVDLYNAMDDYTKGFLDKDTVNKLTDLVTQMNILVKKQEELDKSEAADGELDEEAAGTGAVTPEGAAGEAPATEAEESTDSTEVKEEATAETE